MSVVVDEERVEDFLIKGGIDVEEFGEFFRSFVELDFGQSFGELGLIDAEIVPKLGYRTGNWYNIDAILVFGSGHVRKIDEGIVVEFFELQLELEGYLDVALKAIAAIFLIIELLHFLEIVEIEDFFGEVSIDSAMQLNCEDSRVA